MSDNQLFALEMGDGDPAIVFLHGFGDTHGVWRQIQEAFAGEARTVSFDLPGHGASLSFPDAGRTKIAVAAVMEEIDRRRLNPVHLVGHSMGGAVAALVALERPGAIASITLLAPGGFGSEINHRLLSRYAEANDREHLTATLENMVGWNKPVTDETIERHIAMRNCPGQCDKLVEIAGYMHRAGRQGVIPREQLAKLQMPVKVVWGTQDRVLPTRQAHRLPPMFAAHIFEDTGHMLPTEIPESVIALIRQNLP